MHECSTSASWMSVATFWFTRRLKTPQNSFYDNASFGTSEVTITISNKATNGGTGSAGGNIGGAENNSGGGGSMGWSVLGLLLVAMFRRKVV